MRDRIVGMKPPLARYDGLIHAESCPPRGRRESHRTTGAGPNQDSSGARPARHHLTVPRLPPQCSLHLDKPARGPPCGGLGSAAAAMRVGDDRLSYELCQVDGHGPMWQG